MRAFSLLSSLLLLVASMAACGPAFRASQPAADATVGFTA
jgi:hypothetical protein